MTRRIKGSQLAGSEYLSTGLMNEGFNCEGWKGVILSLIGRLFFSDPHKSLTFDCTEDI